MVVSHIVFPYKALSVRELYPVAPLYSLLIGGQNFVVQEGTGRRLPVGRISAGCPAFVYCRPVGQIF